MIRYTKNGVHGRTPHLFALLAHHMKHSLSEQNLPSLSSKELAEVRLTTTPRFYHCEPGWHWSPPPLPDYDLWYALGGVGEMCLQGTRYKLVPNQCFVLPPGITPRASQDPAHRLHVFAVHFEPFNLEGQVLSPEHLPLPPPGHVVQDAPFFTSLALRCENGWARGDELGKRQAALCVEQMLLLLCEEAQSAKTSPVDRAIADIVRSIREAPGETWNLTKQARRACLSPSQYARRFRAAMGQSPARFVVEVRLERATQLIRETEMSLGQIATVLGYNDLFFFSRQFKQFRGIAPSLLRPTSNRHFAREETAPLSSVKNGLNP